MRAFKDDRGRSYNDVFPDICRGDVNVAVLYPGTIKAFHRHQLQDDWWFVIRGHVRAVLVSEELEKKTVEATKLSSGWYQIPPKTPGASTVTSSMPFSVTEYVPVDKVAVHYLSEGDRLHIPRGVWHGVQNLGNEEAIMIYHITNKYNPQTPDEERAGWNQWFDWKRSRK